MQTVTAILSDAFRAAIKAAFEIDADPLVNVSQNPRFGDYQSNAAMPLAKKIAEKTGQKTNPRQVAEQILAKLNLGEIAAEAPTIAGPGFINVRLSPAWLAGRLQAMRSHERLGIDRVAAPQRVVVDYSGPNIAKEMHVGHLRSTIIGDAIARLLSFAGHDVIRQNHIGDWGLQMGMVTYAVEQAGVPANQLTLRDLEQLYKQINKASEDPAIRRQMAERTRILQNTPKDQLTAWHQVRELTLTAAQELYQRLDVTLTRDDVRGESFYSDRYAPMIQELLAEGHAKETEGAIGLFPPGFTNREGEPRPFIIQSRDGSFQYPTFDLAALRYRVQELRATRIIYTHDSRQAEHFAMLFAVGKMLGWDHVDSQPVQLDYAPFGTVLGEDGKPLKTRSGENIKLADLIDEAEQRALALVTEKNPDLPEDQRKNIAHAVGIGAVKYADLSKDRTSDYVFSWDKMLAMDGNTGPYLQYAHARICAIFRKAEEDEAVENLALPAAYLDMPGGVTAQPFSHPHDPTIRLETPQETALALHLVRFGETLDTVARDLKPHVLCQYLYDLAVLFSSFYENCPVLKAEGPLRQSRLDLCDLVARTLALGLDLLGIAHPEQM